MPTTALGVPDPDAVADHLALTDLLYAYADGIDGDRATAVSQLVNPLILEPGEDAVAILLGGRYVDRLRRVDGAWRIEHRVQAMDWQSTIHATAMPASGSPRPDPSAVAP